MEISKFEQRKRLEFILTQLALKTAFTKIKSDYQQLFETKISGEQIIDVSQRYAKAIEKISEKELHNVRACPAAHSRVRMDFIYQGMLQASTPKEVRSVRTGDNEYNVVYDIDHSALAKYIQLAREEEYAAKKLMLEKIKLEIDIQRNDTGYEPVDVDAGFDDDEPPMIPVRVS